MANLLIIESWVRAVGLVLPEKLASHGHRYTFVSRNPGHYTSWARAAGLVGAASHPLLAGADAVIEANTNDVTSLLRAVRPLHERTPFDGVLTTCDYYLETAARVAEDLALPGSSAAAVEVARHKHLMREACRRAGLPGPRFLAARTVEDALEFADAVGYPVVVKAVDLCSSESVNAVKDPVELDRCYRAITGDLENIRGQLRPPVVLVEELLRGDEFSVETYSFRGRTTVLGVTDKSLVGYPQFIESGLMFPADISVQTENQLATFARSALNAVGYTHGLSHTEIKLTADGPRIVEINARMGGSYLFDAIELVTGLDMFSLLVDLALGRPSNVEAQETGIKSAALKFLLPPRGGLLGAVHGVDAVREDLAIYRLVIDDVVGKELREPYDNNDFIGHVLAIDREQRGARRKAEAAAESLEFVFR
ncbi:MAG: ATP-grasp domain-containing protein [Proteobacteria bacterium]|nr:ATP-grasp domain-containing protein [Pseudomonadota bacterium]